ncbi:site-specific integrase [Shewanella xiamenensis]|uniref:tyrosine-type recombinase/integrase n=1 Tax=Shewanella xiamenensis TaxID=332186 RepID=UPI002E7B1AD7|nr:site-specific integrase [Shewanella xiamenensis]MEE1981617.1 site-specific integrase [Shewanella xiamenensis]
MSETYNHPDVKGATIYKQPQSKKWYISYYNHENKRIQKSAKTESREEAIKILNKHVLVSDMLKKGEINLKTKETRKLILTICNYLIEQINKITNYPNKPPTLRHLKKISYKIGHIYIDELVTTDLNIITQVEESLTTINNYKKCLNMIFDYSIEKELIKYKIKFGKFKIKEKEKRESITLEQHWQIVRKIESESWDATRYDHQENMYLLSRFIRFLRETGLRYGEVLYIKFDDIVIDGEKIIFRVPVSKTRKRKTLITQEALDLLYDIMFYNLENNKRQLKSDEYIFSRSDGIVPNFTSRMQSFKNRNLEFFKSIGLEFKEYSCYTERHSFICDRISKNKNIHDIAEHAGNSTAVIEKYYRDDITTRSIDIIYDKESYHSSSFDSEFPAE